MKVSVSLMRMMALVLGVVAVAYISITPIVANDFWLQTKVGEIIANERVVPRTILFPFTEIASERFNAHEWLASLAFYGATSVIGEPLLPFAQGALGLLLFGLLVCLAWLRSRANIALALAVGLTAIWIENYRHFLRPEMLAVILFTAFWIGLELLRRRVSAARILILVVIAVLWANIHGSFVLAPVLAGMYSAGMFIDAKRGGGQKNPWPSGETLIFAAVAIVALACAMVNPFGWESLRFVTQFSTSSYVQESVPEWSTMLAARYSEPRGFWIGIMALITIVLTCASNQRKRTLSAVDVFIVVGFGLLALYSIRFVIYLSMVFAYMVPSLFPPVRRRDESDKLWYATTSAIAVCSLAVAAHYGNAWYSWPTLAAPNVKFSDRLVEILESPELKGNVLNSVELGSELVYRTYPRMRPSIDSRIDSYGFDYAHFNYALIRNDGLLREYVARYDVRYVLLDSVRFEHFKALGSWRDGLWKTLFFDGKEALLIRADLPFPSLGIALPKSVAF